LLRRPEAKRCRAARVNPISWSQGVVDGESWGEAGGAANEPRTRLSPKDGTGVEILAAFIYASLTLTVPQPQELNRYSYVTNNPYRYIDPTGYEGDDDGDPGESDDPSDPTEDTIGNSFGGIEFGPTGIGGFFGMAGMFGIGPVGFGATVPGSTGTTGSTGSGTGSPEELADPKVDQKPEMPDRTQRTSTKAVEAKAKDVNPITDFPPTPQPEPTSPSVKEELQQKVEKAMEPLNKAPTATNRGQVTNYGTPQNPDRSSWTQDVKDIYDARAKANNFEAKGSLDVKGSGN